MTCYVFLWCLQVMKNMLFLFQIVCIHGAPNYSFPMELNRKFYSECGLSFKYGLRTRCRYWFNTIFLRPLNFDEFHIVTWAFLPKKSSYGRRVTQSYDSFKLRFVQVNITFSGGSGNFRKGRGGVFYMDVFYIKKINILSINRAPRPSQNLNVTHGYP